ncbi:E3 ubiquitin-protein ligase pellino homolog 2-like isoform X2 [Carassius auratus]|uniref:E3 ubiquitin-protein ligase pellino homolog 2-like isoform X2 n=1 Tax=Carassius auratus TaxID=7957 RepID=A0A6P6N7T4_CARAU|nr:E3 ubiquitin-protein ligase pellino homolog 2-like isoform X2 [Carassius auratus]
MLVCVLSVSVCVCALCKMSRFALHRRTRANGVKPSTVHILSNPHNSEAVNSRGQHSISFTLSRNQTVVVEYCHEDHTDMFQVFSRSSNDRSRFRFSAKVPDTNVHRSFMHVCECNALS